MKSALELNGACVVQNKKKNDLFDVSILVLNL